MEYILSLIFAITIFRYNYRNLVKPIGTKLEELVIQYEHQTQIIMSDNQFISSLASDLREFRKEVEKKHNSIAREIATIRQEVTENTKMMIRVSTKQTAYVAGALFVLSTIKDYIM